MYIKLEQTLTELEIKYKDETLIAIRPTFFNDEYIIESSTYTYKCNKKGLIDIISTMFDSEMYNSVIQGWIHLEASNVDNKDVIKSFKEFKKLLDKEIDI